MPKANKVDRGFKWIQDNQDKIFLVMDGLDQSAFQIASDPRPDITINDELLPGELIGQILSRRFLPDIRVIVTSRPHSCLDFGDGIHPNLTVFVNQLLEKDMITLMKYYIPHHDAVQILDKVRRHSARILQLLTTPLFLQLFSMLYCDKGEEIWPYVNTASKLMKTVIKYHQDSAHHSYEGEHIEELEQRIAKMAFDKTENNEIVFGQSDLDQNDLTAQEVQDLLFVVPQIADRQSVAERIRSPLKILSFYFAHQSFQVSS